MASWPGDEEAAAEAARAPKPPPAPPPGPPPRPLWRRVARQLMTEFLGLGEAVVGAASGTRPFTQRWWFSSLLLLVIAAAFFACAGQYAAYKMETAPAATQACLAAAGGRLGWGPTALLLQFVLPRPAAWCFGGRAGALDGGFLIGWGARWAPALRSQWWRWATGVLLHTSFGHLASNALLLFAVGAALESRHGSLAAAAVWLAGALAGGALSAALEDPCTAVVGASGGLYGLVGAWAADTALAWRRVERPATRLLVLAGFAALTAYGAAAERTGVSHWSHAGGFAAGALAAPVLLPKLWPAGRGARAAVRVGCAAALAVAAITVVTHVYVAVLPAVCCGCASSASADGGGGEMQVVRGGALR